VRVILAEHPGADVTVQLLPGLHHVGDHPLTLGPADGGTQDGWVTWRSVDPRSPAVVGAPIEVTGWKPHPTVKGALMASVAGTNITKTTPLRQFWVAGQRAERPVIYGHGRQPGDNRKGYCLALNNTLPTPMYPTGSAFDFTHETATDPASWKNPEDVEFVYTSCDAINCWIEPRCVQLSTLACGYTGLTQTKAVTKLTPSLLVELLSTLQVYCRVCQRQGREAEAIKWQLILLPPPLLLRPVLQQRYLLRPKVLRIFD
jgi:hypothetical protein